MMSRLFPSRTVRVGLMRALAGLIIGTVLGLLLSRAIAGPRLSNKDVASLGVSAKEDYIAQVAAAYTRHRDLERAQAQLERLEAPNLDQWIANLIERSPAEDRGQAGVEALIELAHGLGVSSPAVLAYLSTKTPLATNTPYPTPTPMYTPTATHVPPTEEPTAVLPTATPQPLATETPPPRPSDTPVAPTPTASPSDTPRPQSTSTPEPQPTSTPATKWTWTARLVGPGQEGQTCTHGLKLIRVTVLDAAGSQLSGVWVHEQYTAQYRVSGHKGDDPYWGPGEAEFSELDGGRVCIATSEGGPCESDFTRDLPCHDPPSLEDFWVAGYCRCCEPDISKERCQELVDAGNCLGIAHYAWRVEFRRSW